MCHIVINVIKNSICDRRTTASLQTNQISHYLEFSSQRIEQQLFPGTNAWGRRHGTFLVSLHFIGNVS